MPFHPVLKLCRTDEPMIGKRPIVVPGPWARVLQIRTWRGRRWKTPVPSAPPTCGVVVARGRLRAPAGNHPERVGDPVVGCWPMGEGGAGREKKKLGTVGRAARASSQEVKVSSMAPDTHATGWLSYPSVLRTIDDGLSTTKAPQAAALDVVQQAQESPLPGRNIVAKTARTWPP